MDITRVSFIFLILFRIYAVIIVINNDSSNFNKSYPSRIAEGPLKSKVIINIGKLWEWLYLVYILKMLVNRLDKFFIGFSKNR